MKIKQSISIEERVVEHIGSQNGLSCYVTGEDDPTIYIANSEGEIICKLEILTDCNQNMGYVDEVKMIEIKPEN